GTGNLATLPRLIATLPIPGLGCSVASFGIRMLSAILTSSNIKLFHLSDIRRRACLSGTFEYLSGLRKTKIAPSHASLIETPVLWLGRLCIFYALLKIRLVGSHVNPLVSVKDVHNSQQRRHEQACIL
ncbi:hypothetical protein S83_052301, partial [Arachis hypogaea]